jgi:hypothetical protein
MLKNDPKKQVKISKIGITRDKMSGRGGLFFMIRYIENTQFYSLFYRTFGRIKKTTKGLSCHQFIKQMLAHFIDGSDMAMTAFDRRKQDRAYAALLENQTDEMASSHQIKRFFGKLGRCPQRLFRHLLLELFIWRLHIEQPTLITLFVDSKVLDNHDAHQRQGVEPTYKKKNGFQPLHICWGRYLVDAIFRSGSVHGNHGNDVIRAITRLTLAIRKRYRDVPIILISDSAFMDDDNFNYFENKLGIFYICAGKHYDDLKRYVQAQHHDQFGTYSNNHQTWRYLEFGNRLKSWSTFRRCIFTTPVSDEHGQLLLAFAKSDQFIYTNIGLNKQRTEHLIAAGGAEYVTATKIIEISHSRGAGELTHRSHVDFLTKEQLPFERFGMNRAYYYLSVVSHFLYEAFKHDVTHDIIPQTCYPTTFRRRVIDFAVKVISSGGQFILKVVQTVYDDLKLDAVWERIAAPEPIPVT